MRTGYYFLTGLIIITVWSCSFKQKVITNDYFNYPYEKVYDYHVVKAWRDLDERVPAYTPEMVALHTHLVGKLPWITPTVSGDKNMVLGQTSGWPKNSKWPDDPEIPPQKIYGYQITDTHIKGPKIKMILTSQNHGTEFTGSWVLEGMVNFLASSDPEAVFLRTKAIFYVYPDINPEGRYQSVYQINLEAAPDPKAGIDGCYRGNPELYAAGESDYNRVWNTSGRFSTIDIITAAMIRDTGGEADYLWDMHGPQEKGNWRTPSTKARTNKYAEALMKREPDVIRCGPESGYKVNVASGNPGKLSSYAFSEDGLHVTNPYVYEPGGWTRERLMESGRNLALALYDVLSDENDEK